MSYTYPERGPYRNLYWDLVNSKFILRFSVIRVTFLDTFVAKVGVTKVSTLLYYIGYDIIIIVVQCVALPQQNVVQKERQQLNMETV